MYDTDKKVNKMNRKKNTRKMVFTRMNESLIVCK